MSIHDDITDALMLIGRLREAAMSTGREAEAALWRHVRECVFFICRTGQEYRLEDHLESLDPTRPSYHVSEVFKARADATSQQARALLLRTLGELADPGEKRLMRLTIDMVDFIASSGQWDDFEDYLKNYYADAPPAIAYFETQAEAEAWLLSDPEPPSQARILIGNEYFEAWYQRDTNERRLLRSNIIELFLEDFARKGLAPPVAAFHTREEAQEWLESHPIEPMGFIHIGGENYFVVWQKRLNRHSLHHVASTLEEWEEEKRRRAERQEELTPATHED